MGNYPNRWIKVFYSKGAGYGSEPHNFEGKSIVDETLVEVKGSELSDFISQTKQELIEKFLDDLGYAYIHDKDGRKNIEVLIGMYNIKLEELKKLSNK